MLVEVVWKVAQVARLSPDTDVALAVAVAVFTEAEVLALGIC